MDHRTLELTLISAKGLKNVNLIGKMDIYAVVSISGGHQKEVKFKTPVDNNCGSTPSWNFPMKFTVDDSTLNQNRLTLVVKIKHQGVLGDKDVGEVQVPAKELLDAAVNGGKQVQFVSYQVRKPSGKPKGELSFSYKFGEVEKVAGKDKDEPVTAYPAPMVTGSSSAYPPPQPYAAPSGSYPPPMPAAGYYPPPAGYPQPAAGYAYQQHQQPPPYTGYMPPPPPGGYGYPPQPGYGYAPPVQQPPKKNKFGMGLGAGLLGGALGGLLIGDIVSDAADGGGCGGGCGGF